MPSGFDSAWCRVSPAPAMPNKAVPLPAWAGYVTRPGLRILCRQIDRHSGGQIGPFPKRDAYHPRADLFPQSITQCRPDVFACAKPGNGPCMMTGISGNSGFPSRQAKAPHSPLYPPPVTPDGSKEN